MKTTIRPKIEIIRNYAGYEPMESFFSQVLAEQVKKALCSVGTFDTVREPEYNEPKELKEAV